MSKKSYESLVTTRLRLRVALDELVTAAFKPLGGLKASVLARHEGNRRRLTESIARDTEVARRLREDTQ